MMFYTCNKHPMGIVYLVSPTGDSSLCPLCTAEEKLKTYMELDEILIETNKPKTGRRMGEEYWYITGFGEVAPTMDEYPLDDKYWNFGNYFYTEAQVEEVLNNFINFIGIPGKVKSLSDILKSRQRHFGIRGDDE